MAWRFKASKYKNAAPIVPKPELCVRDICVGSYQTYGNNIAASAAFMAFNWEHAGSSLAVLPIDDCGRKSKSMPLLHGHTDTVTDLHFSPFHDGLLATGSQDCLVKIWFIPEKGLESSLTEPECTFSHKQRRVETVGFHPAADCLLHSTSAGNVTLWDISQQKEVFSNNEHPEVIQSLSWKQDGTIMTTSCKDKIVRILDPRISDPITMQALSHQSIKDSRVVWLGDQQRILTTGFDSSRLRQIIIRDLRKFDETEKTLELDCSTGILMPLYDADTNMLFLAGKGDTTISYMEVTDNAPYLTEGLRHNGEQTKGACLVPKRALRIMEGEVNRIMQLTSNSVIPIMYQVPRKTYRDFHSDLYPDTNGYTTDLSVQQWMNGVNVPVPKMSLDPAKRENGDQPIVIHKGNLDEFIKNQANNILMKNVTNNKTNTIVVDAIKNKYKIDKQSHHHNQYHQQQQSSVIATSPKRYQQQSHQIVVDDHSVITKSVTKRELLKRFDNKYKETKMLINNNNDDDNNIEIKTIGQKIEEDVDDEYNKDKQIDCDVEFDDDSISIINDNRMEEKINFEVPKNNGHKNNGTDHSNGEYIMNTANISIPSIPPKPLPRTSRNNSMSDQGNNTNSNNNNNNNNKKNHNQNINNNNQNNNNNQQTEINLSATITAMTNTITTTIPITTSVEEDFDNKYPLRPVARPRTTTSYKPRLGPKPFTSSSCSGDISFDKVFSVPQVPGNDSLEHDHLNNTSTESSESSIDEQKPDSLEKNLQINEEKEHYNNGNYNNNNDDDNKNNNDHINDHNVDDVDNDIDNNNLTLKDTSDCNTIRNTKNKLSDEEEIIKDEQDEEIEDTNESETFMDTADDRIDSNLQRLSINRCSIAERRKIYERSLSSQEERTMAPPQSPLPTSKKELMQNRMEAIQIVDDNKTKSFHQHHHHEHSKPFDDATNGHQNNKSSKHNNGCVMDIKKKTLKNQQSEPNTATKRTSTVFGKVSKFRHLKGTPGHKSTHIENIRNISRQIPGECNGFHANHQRAAVPISGPGGKIAVYELNKPGRLPDGVIPSLVNSSNIMDFQWDPFDSHKLVVACDDGIVKIWNIPENGLLEPINTCDREFPAHSDKIYFIRFHQLAQNVLLTSSYDMTMKLWDLNTLTEKICLQGHTEQIFDFAWSPCGELGASVCKDGKIRIFNPRKSGSAILEGNGPIGTRGARIAWALDGQYILCTGFDKVSERQISIYKLTNLSTPLNVVGLDVSPAILMLFYDEDSSTVLLTGRGDSTIYAFEITDEAPHICPLSHHRCPTLHQGLSFLTKNYCDVVAVEFAKALRLTNNTIEPLSFTVPRIKTELFQDDLFPPTRITWSPTMSSVEWFSMKHCPLKKINLQPDGMECLTTVQQAEKHQTKKAEISQISSQNISLPAYNRLGFSSESDKAKQKEIQQSVSARMEYTTKLEQDTMEGVEEKEWDE